MKDSKLLRKLSILMLFCIVTYSCSSSENESDDMAEDPTNLVVEGRYSGSIELTLAGDRISVPATLTVNEDSPTRYSGDFFETSNFTPCCSTNPQDGTFTFEYDPADMSIENLVIRVDFNINPAVPCTGIYTGSGMAEFNDGRISIETEILVNDCNVSDTMATLNLTKIGEL